jgi:hypothetical protein
LALALRLGRAILPGSAGWANTFVLGLTLGGNASVGSAVVLAPAWWSSARSAGDSSMPALGREWRWRWQPALRSTSRSLWQIRLPAHSGASRPGDDAAESIARACGVGDRRAPKAVIVSLRILPGRSYRRLRVCGRRSWLDGRWATLAVV